MGSEHSEMSATRELVDAYMAAVEAKDGAALFALCDGSAKIFGTDDELFIDFAEVNDAAACDALVKAQMGAVNLTYSDRVVEIEEDQAVEKHGVKVEMDGNVVANLVMEVTLTFADGKVIKATEQGEPVELYCNSMADVVSDNVSQEKVDKIVDKYMDLDGDGKITES